MSSFFQNLANVGRKLNRSGIDPIGSKIDTGAQNFVMGKPGNNRNYYGEGPIAPPGPPTQDTAANAATQQSDYLRRRRGVMANIAAGNAGSPTVQNKSALGS